MVVTSMQNHPYFLDITKDIFCVVFFFSNNILKKKIVILLERTGWFIFSILLLPLWLGGQLLTNFCNFLNMNLSNFFQRTLELKLSPIAFSGALKSNTFFLFTQTKPLFSFWWNPPIKYEPKWVSQLKFDSTINNNSKKTIFKVSLHQQFCSQLT